MNSVGFSEFEPGSKLVDPKDWFIDTLELENNVRWDPSEYFGATLMGSKLGSSPEATVQRHADRLRADIRAYLDEPNRSAELDQVLQTYPIPEHIKDNLGISRPGASILESLSNADNDSLAAFASWNMSYIEKKTKENQGLTEQLKQEWYRRVRTAILEQNLPVSIEQLEARMAQVYISLGDPLLLVGRDEYGYYNPANRHIVVGASLPEEVFKATLNHELMHHLSGQTAERVVSVDQNPLDDETWLDITYSVRRAGLCINNKYESREWADEAVTEQLTQLLLDSSFERVDFSTLSVFEFFQPMTGVYRNERDRLQEFMLGPGENMAALTDEQLDSFPGKIPVHVVLRAYFEDHIPSKPKGTKAVARRALWAKIIETYPLDYHQQLSSQNVFPIYGLMQTMIDVQ